MANTLNLSIGIIGLAGVPFTVANRTATSNLTATNVLIKKFDGSAFADFTAFTLASASATGGTITPTANFVQGDLLLIQIVDGADKSDRVSVDFSEDYTGHDAITPFLMPDEAGTYKLNVQTVNEEDFSATAASDVFTVGKMPTTTNSSISLNYKSYLVKFAGTKYDVKIVLDNGTSDAAEGNYEVIFKAKKQ